MRKTMAALAALGLMAFADRSAADTEAAADNAIISRPDWAEKPNGEDLARYYPERAARLEKEGRATVLCRVDARGRLQDCKILDESPEGYGFGDATLKLVGSFRMRPQTRDGVPVDGGTVRIPMVYRLPEDSAPVGLSIRLSDPAERPAPVSIRIDTRWLMGIVAGLGLVLALGAVGLLLHRERNRAPDI